MHYLSSSSYFFKTPLLVFLRVPHPEVLKYYSCHYAQRSLLVRLKGPEWVLGIKPRLAMSKASSNPQVYLSSPSSFTFFMGRLFFPFADKGKFN